jgi:hypothetical protein
MTDNTLPHWAPDNWVRCFRLPILADYELRGKLARDNIAHTPLVIQGDEIIYCTEREVVIFPCDGLQTSDEYCLGNTVEDAIAGYVERMAGTFKRVQHEINQSEPTLAITDTLKARRETCASLREQLARLSDGKEEAFAFSPLPTLPEQGPIPIGATLAKLWDGIFNKEMSITTHTIVETRLSQQKNEFTAHYTFDDNSTVSLPLTASHATSGRLAKLASNVSLFSTDDAARDYARSLLTAALEKLSA